MTHPNANVKSRRDEEWKTKTRDGRPLPRYSG